MPHSIYRIESLGEKLGASVSGTRHVYLRAVAKQNNPNGSAYCIPNELICGEIGRFIGLPIPPVAIVSLPDGKPYVASLDFNLTGHEPPPVDVDACVRLLPSLSTGLLLFDIWVANPDRHNGNFAVDFESRHGNRELCFQTPTNLPAVRSAVQLIRESPPAQGAAGVSWAEVFLR
jgi:hypothetical protein